MVKFVEDLENNGPQIAPKPKKPRVVLPTMKQKYKNLVGENLNEYLMEKLVTFWDPLTAKIDDSPKIITFDSLVAYLKKCAEFVQMQESDYLGLQLKFGKKLEKCYAMWREKPVKDQMPQSWQVWLKENVRISDSYARKLQAVHEILKDYLRFYNLRLSFNEIYQRKEDKSMLNNHTSYRTFWSERGQLTN